MESNDTLGAGSYPTPPESDVKDYRVTFTCSCVATAVIQARSREEMEDYLVNSTLNELRYDCDLEFHDLEFEDLLDCEEE